MDDWFSLTTEVWLPVRRRSGPALIRVAEVVDRIEEDPVLGVEWSRADFRFATLEFLIGLLSTVLAPADEDEWERLWHEPPTVEMLDATLAPVARAFLLDGPGPRFMQDFETLPGAEGASAGTLLIEAPGANTERNNTDLMVKRGRIRVMSRAAAAMALFTLQNYAPSGGAGHRVGLRGGGPLTTLVLPTLPKGRQTSLWHILWAHVSPGVVPGPERLPRVFPWLAPTRTSENKKPPVTPEDADPLQVFWAMPRRIRLIFSPNEVAAPCDLTGAVDPVTVTGWLSRPNGASYAVWQHPLSPRYRQKMTEPWLAVHPQPGGIGYRHWVGLVAPDKNGLRVPADAVRRFRDERSVDLRLPHHQRLLAGGFDMDNMKARGFVESEMPLPALESAEANETLDALARQAVEAAGLVADVLRGAVRRALFSENAGPELSGTLLSTVRERFWAATEREFFALIDRAVEDSTPQSYEKRRRDWLDHLAQQARRLFDEAAPLDPDSWSWKPRKNSPCEPWIVTARRMLSLALTGFGKQGKALFTILELPAAEAKTAGRKPKVSP